MELKIRAQSAPWNAEVEFLITGNGQYAENLVMRTMEDGMRMEPTCSLSRTMAQVLMDDLWNAGLRPTEGTGSAGSLAATQRHLEDMRTLVFNKRES